MKYEIIISFVFTIQLVNYYENHSAPFQHDQENYDLLRILNISSDLVLLSFILFIHHT